MEFPSIGIPTISVPQPVPVLDYDTRPIFHQLVVIGNGFDQECGLKSDFGSFIEARNSFFKSDSSQQDGADEGQLIEFNHTIWDCILAERVGDDWCDIESTIAEWVIPSSNNQLFADVEHVMEKGGAREHFKSTLSRLEKALASATYNEGHDIPRYNIEEALLIFCIKSCCS